MVMVEKKVSLNAQGAKKDLIILRQFISRNKVCLSKLVICSLILLYPSTLGA